MESFVELVGFLYWKVSVYAYESAAYYAGIVEEQPEMEYIYKHGTVGGFGQGKDFGSDFPGQKV